MMASYQQRYCSHCRQVVDWMVVEAGATAASGTEHVLVSGSATVRAHGSATVEAYGSATVEAHDSATVRAYSPFVATIRRSSKSAVSGGIIADAYEQTTDPVAWLRATNATVREDGTAVLYKRTAADFSTQKGVRYVPGTDVEAPDWDPVLECGGGLHFCSSAAGCDQFRSGQGDRYVACAVNTGDMVVHVAPDYPEKIKAARCRVLYECDREGRPLEPATGMAAAS